VFGNLIQVTEPNPAGGANYQSSYTYDPRNQLTQVQMPRDGTTQVRTFTYNDDGQLTQSVNPETGTVNYTYNGEKLLASRTDNRGQKVEYSYDTHRRLTQVRRYPNGTTEDVCQRVNYAYDTNAVDGTFTQNGWGRRTTESFNVGCGAGLDRPFIYMYSYNQGGLVTKKGLRRPMEENPPPDVVFTYTYNGEGQVTSITYPPILRQSGWDIGDETFTYEYDSMGRPNRMRMQYPGSVATDVVNPVTYGPSGEIRQWNHVTFDYNALLQMTRMANVEYRYTAGQNNGRMASMAVTGGEEVVYQYDALNRLVSAQTTGPQWGNAYGYDGFGNLTSMTVTKGTAPSFTATVWPTSNQLVGRNHDGNGNMTWSPTWGPLVRAKRPTTWRTA